MRRMVCQYVHLWEIIYKFNVYHPIFKSLSTTICTTVMPETTQMQKSHLLPPITLLNHTCMTSFNFGQLPGEKQSYQSVTWPLTQLISPLNAPRTAASQSTTGTSFRFRFISMVAQRLKITENEMQNLQRTKEESIKEKYNKQQHNMIQSYSRLKCSPVS